MSQQLRRSVREKQPTILNRDLGYVSPSKGQEETGKRGKGVKSRLDARPLNAPDFIPPPSKGDLS